MAKRTTTRPSGPLETKPFAGLSTNLVAGYIVTFVFATWPWIADRVPDDLKVQLPVVLGTALGALIAYYAPHTHRPDLPPVQPPPLARLVERPPQMQPSEEDPGPGRTAWSG